MITYDAKLKQKDVLQLHALLKTTYWASERSIDAVRESLKNSVVIFARDESGDIVGSARAVTDQTTFSWICDVVVAAPLRGQGIGKHLVSLLLEDERIKCTRKILVTKDAHGLYEQFGFKSHPYECMICYEGAPQQGGQVDVASRRHLP